MLDGVRHVYHYTSLKGLEGIVKNRTLRFTDHRFLNDFGEFVRPFEKLKEILEPELQEVLSNLYMAINAEYSIAICCVSNTCDSLAQMRLYADDCKGAAIVLSTNVWELASQANGRLFNTVELFESSNTSIFKEPVFTPISSCTYGELESYCYKLIEKHKPLLNKLDNYIEWKGGLRTLPAQEAEEIFNFFTEIARWKDLSFREEQELRSIAFIPKDYLQYESREMDIRPYWDWNTQGNNLDSLILGVILGSKCSDKIGAFLSYHLGSSNYSNESSPQIEWGNKVASAKFDRIEPTNNYFCFKQKVTYE